MADSSSRFGLCITVRPGSHKAISVKDLRWRERSILILFFGHLYIQWMLGYWSDVPNSSAPSLTAFLFWIEHSSCSFSGDDHKLWLFFINTTNNFSPGCHKLSSYWHTLRPQTLWRIERYKGMLDGGSQACPSSPCYIPHLPFVFSWQASLQRDMTWNRTQSAVFAATPSSM